MKNMAKKQQLRTTRAGTIINATSKKQESDVIQALTVVVQYLMDKYGKIPQGKIEWHSIP